MKVAIDKECINQIKDFTEFEYIYVFDDEPLQDLLDLKLHCIHKDYICEIEDIKYFNKKDYKFAIIVPSYNNDHRKL